MITGYQEKGMHQRVDNRRGKVGGVKQLKKGG